MSNQTNNLSREALIDADILCYRIGFAYEKETKERLITWQIDRTINNILDSLDVDTYKVYLTSLDKSNFRYEIAPDYKANRTAPRPKWFGTIRDYLVEDYGAEVVTGQEADDAIGIEATTPDKGKEKIIVSLDKDFNQIPGLKYNFVSKKITDISSGDAERFLGYQLLSGDSTDNIKGLRSVGKIKANKYLKDLTTRREILEKVSHVYLDHYKSTAKDQTGSTYNYKNEALQALQQTSQLIFIRRYKEKCLQLPEEIFTQ